MEAGSRQRRRQRGRQQTRPSSRLRPGPAPQDQSEPPREKKRRGFFGGLIDFTGWLLLVGLLLAAVVAAGWFYLRGRADGEICKHVLQKLAEHYPDMQVKVGDARLVEGKGVEIRKISIGPKDQGPNVEIVRIDEIFVECDATMQNLLTRDLPARRITVRGLRLQARRELDGSWNTARLFPLPEFGEGATPPVTIEESSVELIDDRQHGDSIVLRDVRLAIEPEIPSLTASAANEHTTSQPDENAASDKNTPQPVLRLHGSFTGDHFHRIDFAGRYDADNRRWAASGAVESLTVSPRLLAVLPRQMIPAAELPSINGLANLKFQCSGSEGVAPRFDIAGAFSQGHIDDNRLPAPLSDVRATFQCDNEKFRIEDLTAKGGLGALRLSLTRWGYAPNSPLTLQAKTEGLVLDHRLVRVLPTPWKKTWDEFAPLGMVNAEAALAFDGKRWKPDLTMECLDVSFAYHQYPYRVERGRGTLRYRDDQAEVRVTARASGQPVRFVGDIRNPGPQASGTMEVTLDDPIPLDEKLFASLDPETQKVVRALRPRGMITMSARFHRERPDAPLQRWMKVTLHDCAVNFVEFPYPIERIRGTLEMTDGKWELRDIAGYNDGGYITFEGDYTPEDEKHGVLDLDIVATDLPLDEELRDALAADAQRVWNELRPRGTIDHIKAGLRYETRTEKRTIDVEAQKWRQPQNAAGRTISIMPTWFSYRMENVTGTFRFREGRIDLVNVAATHGRTGLTMGGHCNYSDDGRWRLSLTRLTADRLRADNDLIAALPPSLGKGLANLNLSGPVNMFGAVELAGSGKPDDLATSWNLNFDVEDGSLDCGVRLDHIRGGVSIRGAHNAQGMQCGGMLNIDSAMYKGVHLTQIRGPLRLDKSNAYFGSWTNSPAANGTPQQVTAQVFGGTLSGDARVSLTGDKQFALHSTLSEADLKKLAKEVSPQSSRNVSGKGYAVLDLQGVSGRPHTLRGKGVVRLRSADLNEVPVMLALLGELFRTSQQNSFSNSDIDFQVVGDDVYFKNIHLSGDAYSLKGTGRMDFQRQIDLDLYTVVGKGKLQIPLFSPLLGAGSRELLRIRVGGTLDKPEPTREVLPALNETLQQLFPELARTPRKPNRPPPPRR